MMLVGVLVAVPLLVAPFNAQDIQYIWSFIIPASFSILSGFTLYVYGRKKRDVTYTLGWKPSMQQSSIIVMFAWLWGILIGALPFFVSGQLLFTQALFESISGWTTTGLSVMDTSITPKIFLFHRSFMQFCGGLGFVMMMNMFIQEKQSMGLYHAEGHSDKLLPNLRKTTQLIFMMYGGLLVAGTILYQTVGMGFFESLVHAMCALSTGGFSTRMNSIGDYNSIGIEIVTALLMLFGTTNFAVLFLIFKLKWKKVARISEVQLLFWLSCICIPVFAFGLYHDQQYTGMESFRIAAFNVLSAISTTGYSSIGFTNLPPASLGITIVLMLIGGGIGSTAGGIKLERVYVSMKLITQNVHSRIHPSRSVHPVYYYKAQGKNMIDDKLIRETTAHVFSYMSIIVIGTIALSIAANCTLVEALFEFSSAFGTVGLSIGITSPNLNNGAMLVEMFGMLLGRLEIFIVFIAIHSSIELAHQKLQIKHKDPIQSET